MNLQEFLELELEAMITKKAELEREIRDTYELLYALRKHEANESNKRTKPK